MIKYFFNFTFFVFVGSSLVITGIEMYQGKKSNGADLHHNFLQVSKIQSLPPSFPPMVVPRYVLKVEKIYYTRKPRYEFRPVDRVYFKDSIFVQKYTSGRDTILLPVNLKIHFE